MDQGRNAEPSSPSLGVRLLVTAASLLLTAVLFQGIWLSSTGGDEARRRFLERRNYYEKVIRPANLSAREGLFWSPLP